MTRHIVDSGLPQLDQPFSWTVKSSDTIYTTHGPVTPQGTILDGDVTEQTELTLQNLAAAMQAGGGSLNTVQQATVYILDVADMAAVDAVWRRYFSAPWPNRATLVVKALVAPSMRVEVQATGTIGN